MTGSLRADRSPTPEELAEVERLTAATSDPIGDPDLHLALATCYQLHYSGFDDVTDDHEWDPALLQLSRQLEHGFVQALRGAVGNTIRRREGVRIDDALKEVLETPSLHPGPSLSRWMLKNATAEQFKEYLRQRSVYQLKEADPHTWALPRTTGKAKAALVEIQADEYGGGRHDRMHNVLFAQTMTALGLDPTYGTYWPEADGTAFAADNLITLLGLHRRWRGAILGHLAGVEMDSSIPCKRYANTLRRLGYGSDATFFFDEHVEADAVHEQLAAVDMCGNLVSENPELYEDVLFGAAALQVVEGRFGAGLVQRWEGAGVRQGGTAGQAAPPGGH